MGTNPGCHWLVRGKINFINQKKNEKVEFRKIKAGGRGCAAAKSNGVHLWRIWYLRVTM
jgi:hypothetical protein